MKIPIELPPIAEAKIQFDGQSERNKRRKDNKKPKY